jgi:hypothetical protein
VHGELKTSTANARPDRGGRSVCAPHVRSRPMGGRMVDGRGRVIEVIMFNRDGTGPQPWYRVSWHHGILLGRG